MQKYGLQLCDGESGRCRADMCAAPDGDYCLASDVDAEREKDKARIAELQARVSELEDELYAERELYSRGF